jgi:FkbM family methyltransferase
VSAIRRITKLCIVLILGRTRRPRKIVRGLASGYLICVSPSENLGYLIGSDEPYLQKAIRKYVAPGDTVYDIGANMGYVSLSLAKRVGPSGHVIAFEPVPRNVALLRTNIENNHLRNIQVLEVAALDRCGTGLIRIAENLSTASLIWHRNNPSATELIIHTVAIDSLVEARELPEPRFVKIDVEGAEGLALLGMRRTVAAARPVLFIECSDAGREMTWQLLNELDYRCQSAITGRWIDAFDKYRHSHFLWLPVDHAS